MNKKYKEDWVEVSFVKDLNYIKTGVDNYSGLKEYYSTGSIKENNITSEGMYSYSSRPSRANRLGLLGDVLQARMKDTDKAVLINDKLNQKLFSTGFIQIRPNPKNLIAKFIFYYLKSTKFLNEKDKNCSGSTQSALNDKSAQNIFIPLAPLPIQRAIVTKIETLFTALDKGIEDLKKAQDQLKIYRQAVLKKAFERELINKYDISVDHTGTPETVKLGDIADMCLGKMLDKKKNIGEFKPYLGNINVRWGQFDLANLKEMKFEPEEKGRFLIQKNDLIICEGGEPGRCAVWDSDNDMFIQKALHRVRLYNEWDSYFIYYYIFYLAHTDGLSRYFTGTTIKHLTGRKLRELIIPFFKLKEQHQIVKEIETRLSVCDQVEEAIKSSLEKSEALRQSILKKAFDGKLLSEQEIAQCKLEEDYEPAGVLLRRIEQSRNERIKQSRNISKKK